MIGCVIPSKARSSFVRLIATSLLPVRSTAHRNQYATLAGQCRPQSCYPAAYSCGGANRGESARIARRDPEETPEVPREVASTGEADLLRDVGEGPVGAGEQQSRPFDPATDDIAVRRATGGGL